MSKIRIYELAKKTGAANKDILGELSKLGIEGKIHTSSIALEIAKQETPVALEEEEELKLPDRFRKEIETEKVEKFKAKPGMQKAFQAVRKIEPKRWHEQKPFKKAGRARTFHKEERKPSAQPIL